MSGMQACLNRRSAGATASRENSLPFNMQEYQNSSLDHMYTELTGDTTVMVTP